MEVDRVTVIITTRVVATRAKVKRTKVAAVTKDEVTAKSCTIAHLMCLSTAFMNAPVQANSCDLVLFLRRVNSLHKGPGTTETFELTLLRLEVRPGALILLLVYGDPALATPSRPRVSGEDELVASVDSSREHAGSFWLS